MQVPCLTIAQVVLAGGRERADFVPKALAPRIPTQPQPSPSIITNRHKLQLHCSLVAFGPTARSAAPPPASWCTQMWPKRSRYSCSALLLVVSLLEALFVPAGRKARSRSQAQW